MSVPSPGEQVPSGGGDPGVGRGQPVRYPAGASPGWRAACGLCAADVAGDGAVHDGAGLQRPAFKCQNVQVRGLVRSRVSRKLGIALLVIATAQLMLVLDCTMRQSTVKSAQVS
jgi:hypothetical protein